MKTYEASAKTVEEAIELGLQELGASIGDVDVQVVEEGSKGLFGLFGSRLAKVKLTVKAADERFTGDLNWTAEALGNILKNSMEHTPEGGEISVEAEETALYTELRILDSGSGFDKEDIPHIFERFYKGKNAADSSVGIGLALARSIIAAQNGAISAKNGKDGGAKFTIRFYKSVI